MILKLILWMIFIGLTLLFIFAFNITGTKSSYGIRKRDTVAWRDGLEFSLWYYKREDLLLARYEEEFCLDMDWPFEEFCWMLYDNRKLVDYEN